MEKGVQKRKGVKRRRRSRGLAKAIAEYLLSDSYMYAPLIDSPSSVSDPGRNPDPKAPPTCIPSPPAEAGKEVPVVQLRRLVAK